MTNMRVEQMALRQTLEEVLKMQGNRKPSSRDELLRFSKNTSGILLQQYKAGV